jgi:transcriptional antiterminator NusG
MDDTPMLPLGAQMSFWMDACWFAIQVKPGLEFNIASVLKNKGYEDFVPTYRSDEDGRGLTERPLFSGYVFCRFDPAVRAPIVTTPGVIRVVGYGRSPASLSDSEMQAVRTVAGSNLRAKPHSYFAPGQRVLIREGPLRGVEGNIAQTGNRQCLVVSVSLLRCSIAVEAEPAWLEGLQINNKIKRSCSL